LKSSAKSSSRSLLQKAPNDLEATDSPGKSLWRKASILVTERSKYKSLGSKEFMMTEYTGKLVDGLSCTLKAPMIRFKGTYLQKTASGHYKAGFIVLKNAELYIYND
jgi:hypothetical protein